MQVRRGDVYYVKFQGVGSEPKGRRPAIVIQNELGNRSAQTVNVVPVTTAQARADYPFMVSLADEEGLRPESLANCAQVMTVDKSRLEERVGRLSEETMDAIEAALAYQFNL